MRLLCEANHRVRTLCFFDTYFVEEDRVFPQLHPGFNEIFGLNCNYFRSRFLARAEAICRIVGKVVPGDAYSLARALIAARHSGKPVLGAHLSQGLMRIEDSVPTWQKSLRGNQWQDQRRFWRRISRPCFSSRHGQSQS